MKIELSQSGGFAGETIKLKEVSTDKLEAPVREQLDALLSETDFFTLGEIAGSDEKGADLLTYHLKITGSKNQTNEVSLSDPVTDPSLAKLLSLVKSL